VASGVATGVVAASGRTFSQTKAAMPRATMMNRMGWRIFFRMLVGWFF